MQPYLIVVGFTIGQAFSLVMTMTQEWLLTFCTNEMLWRKLGIDFGFLVNNGGFFWESKPTIPTEQDQSLLSHCAILKIRITTCFVLYITKITFLLLSFNISTQNFQKRKKNALRWFWYVINDRIKWDQIIFTTVASCEESTCWRRISQQRLLIFITSMED